jgi:hypothetical protein
MRSILLAVGALTAAESLAFVGLLSPGASYPGLFALTSAFVASSFTTVVISAMRQLLQRPLDVQSAALDWSDEPIARQGRRRR